jgi:hypothetical protein
MAWGGCAGRHRPTASRDTDRRVAGRWKEAREGQPQASPTGSWPEGKPLRELRDLKVAGKGAADGASPRERRRTRQPPREFVPPMSQLSRADGDVREAQRAPASAGPRRAQLATYAGGLRGVVHLKEGLARRAAARVPEAGTNSTSGSTNARSTSDSASRRPRRTAARSRRSRPTCGQYPASATAAFLGPMGQKRLQRIESRSDPQGIRAASVRRCSS